MAGGSRAVRVPITSNEVRMSNPIRDEWRSDDGSVRLILGDCLEVLPTLSGIDAVVTDPPYDVVAAGGGIGAKRQYLKEIEGFTDCGFDPAVVAGFPNWMVFCTAKQIPGMFAHVCDRRWMLITWNKPNPTPLCNGNYLPDTEYIFHCWSRGGLHGDFRDKSRFIVYPSQHGLDHPNEKPLPVMTKLVRNAAKRQGVIADPFMGSGTTGVACVRTGRRFVGIEIEPKYWEIAVRRVRAELERFPLFEAASRPRQLELLDAGDGSVSVSVDCPG